MKVFGKNVFNEFRDNVKVIKRVYLASNFTDKEIISFIKDNNISYVTMDVRKMDAMVDGKHQGIIMDIDDYENFPNLNHNFVLLLHQMLHRLNADELRDLFF